MSEFLLNETLTSDTVPITSWPLCRVLLMNDTRYPWLILVPAQPDIKEIYELSLNDQSQLMSELCRASQALSNLLSPDKINIGALGNIVPQLHIHVIARFRLDAAWPNAVWGSHPPIPYKPKLLKETQNKFQKALS
jgi:diadenosine tetraphosphate (Ap4A) HIT family hydrolase